MNDLDADIARMLAIHRARKAHGWWYYETPRNTPDPGRFGWAYKGQRTTNERTRRYRDRKRAQTLEVTA